MAFMPVRYIFIGVRATAQIGALKVVEERLTALKKKEHDLIQEQALMQRQMYHMLFAGAAMLAFAGLYARALWGIIGASEAGAIYMEDFTNVMNQFKEVFSERFLALFGDWITRFLEFIKGISQNPRAMDILVKLAAALGLFLGLGAIGLIFGAAAKGLALLTGIQISSTFLSKLFLFGGAIILMQMCMENIERSLGRFTAGWIALATSGILVIIGGLTGNVWALAAGMALLFLNLERVGYSLDVTFGPAMARLGIMAIEVQRLLMRIMGVPEAEVAKFGAEQVEAWNKYLELIQEHGQEAGYNIWDEWRKTGQEMITATDWMGEAMLGSSQSYFDQMLGSLDKFIEQWNQKIGNLKIPSVTTTTTTKGITGLGLVGGALTTVAGGWGGAQYAFGPAGVRQMGGKIPKTGSYWMHAGEEVLNPRLDLPTTKPWFRDKPSPNVFNITNTFMIDRLYTEADKEELADFVSKHVRDSIAEQME